MVPIITAETLNSEVNNYQGADGELAFWWLGQMGFALRVGELTLYLDPFLAPQENRLVPPLLSAKDLVGCDFVFGSHDHTDHIDYALWKNLNFLSPNTKFVVPKLLVKPLSDKLGIPEEDFVGIDEDVSFDNGTIRIVGIAAAHEFLSPDPESGLHPAMSYLVESGGCRIYHAGDNCKYEGLETKLRNAGKIDLMMVPINGRDGRKLRAGIIGNMDFREAVDLVGMVEPRLAVPAHYDMFEGNTEDPEKFVDYLKVKYPQQSCWVGGHYTCVTVSR